MTDRNVVLMSLATGIGFVLLTSMTSAQGPQTARFWSQWRGPDATGDSPDADPPLEWSETKNVRWKVEIPGRGSASPVVWGDRLFLLTAVPVDATGLDSHTPRGGIQPRQAHRFVVLAIDRATGRVLWERSAQEEEPHEPTHPDNGAWASSSAVTDGEHVFASFESRGLYAYDMEGTLIWQKDLGDKGMRNQFGEGSTPALPGNRLVIVWDHLGGQSFVVALDKGDGIVFLTSGFRGNNLKAIRLADARGDITDSDAIVWTLDRDTPYVPSPLLYDGVLYLLKTNSGILSAFEAASGKPLYQLQRLPGIGEVFSSPVGASGRVYITGRDGTTLVIRQGSTFDVLATNTLDDGFDASPALVGNEIYLRGYRYLYGIGPE